MSTMKIITAGPQGIPGAMGLKFGRGRAYDEDGLEHDVTNPTPNSVPAGVAVVAGRVQISHRSGEEWCVLTIGCHLVGAKAPAPE